MAEPPLNLLDRLKDPKYGDLTESTLHVESTEEAVARRQEASKQADHKRKERSIILWFALVMVVGFSAWCFYVYVTGSVDDKKWAQTIVASICAALLTYAVGTGTIERSSNVGFSNSVTMLSVRYRALERLTIGYSWDPHAVHGVIIHALTLKVLR